MFGAVSALSAAPSLFRRGEGLPSGDDPGALERRSVAGQRWEVAAHFSNGREFAIILQHSTNGIGCRLIYGEHVDSLRKRRARSKPYLMGRSGPGLPERLLAGILVRAASCCMALPARGGTTGAAGGQLSPRRDTACQMLAGLGSDKNRNAVIGGANSKNLAASCSP